MSELTLHRILVVEDHVDSAIMLTRLLKRAGFFVVSAGRVHDALALADEHESAGTPFDLVVSDLGLPDATGYDLMQRLREKHRLRGVALSGYGQSDDVRRALDAGFSYHLTKPIDFDRLKKLITQMLNPELSSFSDCR